MTFSKKLLAGLAIIPAIALLAGCAGGSGSGAAAEDKGTEANPVKIGVVGASDPYWETYKEAAEKEGIFVDIVDFGEYTQPNPALTEGEIDLNQFQHIVYLAQYNEASGEDLTPIGSTAIYPLGLYSTKYKKVSEIQKGDTIAVPNDASPPAGDDDPVASHAETLEPRGGSARENDGLKGASQPVLSAGGWVV